MRRQAGVAIRLLLAAAVVCGLAIAVPTGPAHPACVRAAGEHHVALVVEHGDGRVVTACVAFTGGMITGEQILNASGIEWGAADYGSLGKAVCQVDHEPATYPPNCLQAGHPYWATFLARGGGGWSTTPYGVSRQTYVDGDAAGLRYDPPTGSPAAPPPPGPCPPPPLPPAPPANSALSTAPPTPGGVSAPAPAPADSSASSASPPPDSAATSAESPPPAVGSAGSLTRNSPSAAAVADVKGGSGARGLDLRWLLASAAFGGLAGLLAVRLAARALRRRSA